MARVLVHRGALFALLIPLAHTLAQNAGYKLPKSTIEEFKADSHYGAPISVLNPAFPKEGKVSFGAGGTFSSLSSLYTYYGLNGSAMYYINQRHWIEPIWFSYNRAMVSSFVTDEVSDKSSGQVKSINSVELPLYMASTSYIFSPYYAKMQITPTTVTHFDVFFGAGLAWVRSKNQSLDGVNRGTYDAYGGVGIAGFRFLFGPRYGLRAEIRDFIYPSTNFGDKEVIQNVQMNLSADIFFGSFPDL